MPNNLKYYMFLIPCRGQTPISLFTINGRNRKERKEYIHQSGFLLAGSKVSAILFLLKDTLQDACQGQ